MTMAVMTRAKLGTKSDKRISEIVEPVEEKGRRVILDLSPSATQQLDKMAERLHLNKRTDVVRFALGLLNLYVDHTEKGYELILQKGDEVKGIVVPQQF